MHGNRHSVVKAFLAAGRDAETPLWDGGRAEDEALMASGRVPVLGLKMHRGAARMMDPDANEAGWWLGHKSYSDNIKAGPGHSGLPS